MSVSQQVTTNSTSQLRRTSVAYVTLGFFIIGLVMSLVSGAPLYSLLRENAVDRLHNELHVAETLLSAYLQGLVTDGLTFSNSEGRVRIGNSRQQREALTLAMEELLEKPNDFAGITRTDNYNRVVARVGIPAPTAPWPEVPEAAGKPVFRLFTYGGRPYLAMAVAVPGPMGQPVGVDYFVSDLTGLEQAMRDTSHATTPNSRLVVGIEYAGQLTMLAAAEQGQGLRLVKDPRLEDTLAQVMESREDVHLQPGTPDQDVVLSHPMDLSGWAIAIHISEGNLYGPAFWRTFTIGVTLAALVVAGGLGMRRLLQPLEDRLLIHAGELEQRVADQTAALKAELERRQEAEQVLRESEEKYRTLFAAATDGIFIITPEGEVVDCNEEAALMHGYSSSDEMVGENLRQLVANEFLPQLETILARIDSIDYRLIQGLGRRRDGQIFPAEVNTRRLTLKGEMLIVIFIRDITLRVARESERDALADVAAHLRSASSLTALLPGWLRQVMELTQADGVAVSLHQAEEDPVELTLGVGIWRSATGAIAGEAARLCSQVIRRGQILETGYAGDWTGPTCELNEARQYVIGLPLINDQTTLGALLVGRQTPFSEGDHTLLMAICDIAASSIQRTMLHEQTQERVKRLAALHQIDQSINAGMDPQITMGVLLSRAAELLELDAGRVLLYQPGEKSLQLLASHGFLRAEAVRQGLDLDHSYAAEVLRRHQIVTVDNLYGPDGAALNGSLPAGEEFVGYRGFPLIAKGEVKGVLEVFHRRPFTPRRDWLDFAESLAGQAAIAIDNAELYSSLQRTNHELEVAYDSTLEGWAKVLEIRDQETEGHSRRVADLTIRLAQALGVPENELVHIRRGALLHDIGKLVVPDSILQKNGPLDAEEWKVMMQHPVNAARMLEPIPFLREAVAIPYCHHERWDGTGYPQGLKGEEIPLAARIFAVVDVWDALRSDRPYRPAWTAEQTLEYIKEQSGSHFDPQVVQAFVEIIQPEVAGATVAD